MKKPCSSFWLLAAMTLASPVLIPPGFSSAVEVDKTAVDKMIDLNKKAFADIQGKKFDSAKDALLEAIVVGKEAGLQTHEMMARTHVHMAAVFLTGSKARDKAVNQFSLALKINPNITMTTALDTPALKSAYLLARKQLGLPPQPDTDAPVAAAPEPAASEPATAPAAKSAEPSAEPATMTKRGRGGRKITVEVSEPDLPAKVNSPLHCPLPFEIPPGQDLIIRCLTQKAQSKSTASIFYRTENSGTEDYTEVAMTRSPKGWLTATIPGSAVTGKTLAYYIEAQLPGATEKLAHGRSEAPNAFSIREGAVVVETAEDDDPLKKITISNADDDDTRLFHRRLPGALFLGFSAGTGAGFHGKEYVDSGARDASQLARGIPFASAGKVTAPSGFAPAKLAHFELELGYQFTKKLWLSAFARYQYAPKDGRGGQATGEKSVLTSAIAGFARANYAFATLGNFQAYASGGLGAGKSFLLYFSKTCDEATATNNCALAHSDTVSPNGFAVTASVGGIYHLSRWFAVFVDLKEIATLPKFMALSEANFGLAFAFNILGDHDKTPQNEEEQRGSEPSMENEPPPASE